ncbi:MAG: hypothetical protein WCR33_01185 [Bacilli bacterium]
MRCTQFFGLSKNANDWLEKYCKQTHYFQKVFRAYDGSDEWVEVENSEGTQLVSKPLEENEKVFGMFGEEVYVLQQYEMDNGSIVEEYVQADPWSSGPCIFLCLRFQSTKKFVNKSLWKDEEIEKC